jgi:hypothetical protein
VKFSRSVASTVFLMALKMTSMKEVKVQIVALMMSMTVMKILWGVCD